MPIFRGTQFVSAVSDHKDSVRVCETANIDVAVDIVSSVDSVSLATNDRVLLTGQTLARENGIYSKAANGKLVRSRDADSSFEVTPGLTIYVEEGTNHGKSSWLLTTNLPINLGTTNLLFRKIFQLDADLTIGTGLTGTSYDATEAVTIAIDDTVVATVNGTQTLDNKTVDGGTY